MLKFFRKIRQQLIDENRLSKYLLYAIGEIVLVVIGILIALSINNWNQNLKERQIERQLLKSLKEEITSNIGHFRSIIELHTASRSICIEILKQFSDSNRRMNPAILDSLVENATVPSGINPQIGVVKSIISTGDIKYLNNESIVQFVTMYEDLINESKADFNRVQGVWNSQLWPRENMYIRRINRANANNRWLGVDLPKSSVNSDYDSFFDDIVLENTYMFTLYNQTSIIQDEKEILIQMEDILETINSELLSSP